MTSRRTIFAISPPTFRRATTTTTSPGATRTTKALVPGSGHGINTAALQNLAARVPNIFPDAQPTEAGGYRVKSKMLGRDLQEDLSFHPDGIKDFGVHDLGDEREGKRTPLEIVMVHTEHKDHAAATAWLREQLGLPARRVIRIVGGEIARIVDEAEDALIAADALIFVRAGKLVQPVRESLSAADGLKTEATILKEMSAENIVYTLNSQAADFVRWTKEGNPVRVDPPSKIARHLVKKQQWKFRKIAGVIGTPTMRPDGTTSPENSSRVRILRRL